MQVRLIIHLPRKEKMEIEYVAKMLSKTKISGIYSSPIFRTVESARILARPRKLGVQTIEDLTEAKLKSKFVGKRGRHRILTTPEEFDETYEEQQERVVEHNQ
jgi:broad specificity phosphatase PhoE